MIIPRPQDTIHKAWLYRLLTKVADDSSIMEQLHFKGGTCAAMLGYLNRFSVDLDFEANELDQNAVASLRQKLEKIFSDLGLTVKQFSKVGIQYICRYPAGDNSRNTIKLEVQYPSPLHNHYKAVYFSEIDRTLSVQTIETMFANKLVAVLGRWEKHQSIAGRDIYDIHYFFLQGYRYDPNIIQERCGKEIKVFFQELIQFIDQHITPTTLQQDLNMLLPYDQFRKIYPTLKQETLVMLQDELVRIRH